MARPKAGYFLTQGEVYGGEVWTQPTVRVPGVTTVIPKYSIEGLVWWAWNEGREGRDYRETRDDAANAGALAHDLIEQHVKGEEIAEEFDVDPEIAAKARKGYEAFRHWASMSKLEVVATEMSLVSPSYRFGGTPDAVAMVEIDGQKFLVLIDYKTGSIHLEALIQVAAYRQLWNENNPGDPIFEAHILRTGKEFGDFNHKFLTCEQLDVCWDQFQLYRQAYELHKQIKKMVG